MKHFLLIFTVLFILLGAGVSLAADVNVHAGFEYVWWEDSENNAGYQTIIPIKISSQIKDFSVSLLGGYAYTGYNPHYAGSTHLSQALDTKVNLSYAFVDKLPFDVLLGLDFNVPTGKTKLEPQDLSLIMDPDLVPLSRLGEGFNVNPTISVAKQWGQWMAGLGIGYVWRGEYDYATNITSYNPGDIFTARAEARYEFSSLWNGRVFAQCARFGEDEVNNRPVYREGNYYMGGIGVQYAPQSWDASFTVRYIYRTKSEFQNLSGDLSAPENNIHGNEWLGDLMVRYFWSQPITLWARLTGLLVQENAFPASSSYYVGQRQKVSLELGWRRTFGERWEAKLYVRGFDMHDKARALPDVRGERSYTGFSAGGAVTANF